MKIAKVGANVVGVSDKTNWIHVVVTDFEGNRGVGEATLDGFESMIVERVGQLAARLEGMDVTAIPRFVADVGIEDTVAGLINAAAVSGIESALWDLHGKRTGLPVYRMLGCDSPEPVRLYANINRALLYDRSAEAFRAKAAEAVAAGFDAIKCAPFHNLVRADLSNRNDRREITEALARLRAVRAGIGEEVDLIIECHYRFTHRSAPSVIEELGAFDPFWVEAPVAEHRLGEWAEIRSATNLRLGGGEMMTGLQRFSKFMEATGVDVIMPDIKYVGGISGLREIAAVAAARSVGVAPHNPSGPVSTLASAQAVSGLTNALILEYAYGECDWRSDLVEGSEIIESGRISVSERPGNGADLDLDVVAAHPERPVWGIDLRRLG